MDDVPTALADTDAIAAGGSSATGNVITAVGTTNSGADTLGADGATVAGVIAGTVVAAQSTGVNTAIAGTYGTLTMQADGSYTYVRNAGTPGGVTDTFSYTLKDGDTDTSVTTLTISIGDQTPTVTVPVAGQAGTSVDEAGLPARTISGITELAGSNAIAPSETTSGTINYFQGDGPATVTISFGATTISAASAADVGKSIAGAFGTLTITGFTSSTVSYSYTLADNTSGNNTSETFAVVVTDKDGDATAPANLVIAIVDDVPTALADTDAIAAGGSSATGNVITAVGTTNSGADTLGADGATVAGVIAGTVVAAQSTGVNTAIAGTYGTLTMQADGSYTYVRNAGTPGGVTDTFSYTLKDGDTDTSVTTLTISIGDQTPTVTVPVAGQAGTSVDEAGLPARTISGITELAGSNAIAPSETTSGTINYFQGDGPATVTISFGATTISAASAADVGKSIAGPFGTLTITGFTSSTVSYSYTLADNTSGNNTSETFAVVVTDKDGDATAPANLVIAIVDDVPTALADTDAIAAGGSSATGNVITAVGTTNSGADTLGADGATVAGVIAGTVVAAQSTGVNTAIAGTYGTLTMQADGSYTYVRNAGTPGGVTDTFSYTLKDGDTDTSVTTLTISIGDQTPTVTVPVAGQAAPASTKPVCRPAQSAGSRSSPAATPSPRRRRPAAPSITSRVMARLPSPSASRTHD